MLNQRIAICFAYGGDNSSSGVEDEVQGAKLEASYHATKNVGKMHAKIFSTFNI